MPPHAEVNREDSFPFKLRLLRWLGRQNWIPRGQDKLLRLGCNPDTCEPYGFEVDFFGLRYQGDLSEFLDWSVFMYGSYAYSELSLLQALSDEMRRRAGSVNFFDVGANTGHHTLFMSQHADRVLAFEPSPDARAAMVARISLNRLTNVDVTPVGLGQRDEQLRYFTPAGRNSGGGTLLPENDRGQYEESILVPVRNGDEFIEERSLPRLDILKIDTEGFESFVLRGLRKHIAKDRPVILTEISDRTRQHLLSDDEFRALLYERAIFAEVTGRAGCRFKLLPFNHATACEVLIVPPEWSDFLKAHSF
jgi:FkbM family methyltransferase